jgi:GTP-binding protein
LLEKKLTTSNVNKVIEKSLFEHHLPVYKGHEVRIYYATQTGVYPPTFTLFSNYPAAIPYSYRRYLIHQFQEALGSETVPVKIICRKRT